MGIVTRQTTVLSNRDAKPQIPNPLYTAGRPFTKEGAIVTVTADSATSQYGFFSLPSSCVVTSVALSNDALSASTAMNIGLYETTQYVYSAGVFGSVIAGGVADARYNASALTNTDKTFGSATGFTSAGTKVQIKYANSSFYTFTKATQPLWQVLGFTVDPDRDFDLVATVTVAVVAGGAILLECAYKMQ